ncbi:RNA binding Nrd1 [Fusarium subglutinans]|uniref:RNA binding Nrd1 n=1 Tax=Gibberella subglutinans TaxID=42677 RepID=A0A8H5NTM5_GIBSU|nr:RNA binding Nrd1 [Fusarium subglutinans]KAF5578302.1 RNA binding Nrd1 [Fusarium subglutinans]
MSMNMRMSVSMNKTQKQDGLEMPVSDTQCVYVPQEEYQSLLAIAHQYVYLRQNLIAQGLNEATVDSLCLQKPAGDEPPYASEQFEPSPPAPLTYKEQASTFPVQSNNASGCLAEDQGFRLNRNWQPNASYRPSIYPGGSINQKRPGYFHDNKRPEIKEWFERSAQRSVLLLNVPDGITHGDVAAVIRGGPVLEIFLRNKDNTATVSFLHEADACAFIENCRAAGLYIKDRKIHTKWSDYQFTLSGQVAHHIRKGGSRNFVIRKRDPNLTIQAIRDDLEHIHNLHVISIEFEKDSCFISTNAVHGAIYARTCLQSRVEYRASRIEWYADECAQPFQTISSEFHAPVPDVKPQRSVIPAHPSRKELMGNRFQLLDLSDSEGSNGDDSSDSSF